MVELLRILTTSAFLISLYFGLFWIITFIVKFNALSKEEEARPPLEHHPRVTVCIPAYNEEDTIAKTIESVVQLDYPAKKLDIVVVNDGSRDKTSQRAREVAKKYPSRSIRILDKVNGGKASAMNACLAAVDTEFFVCLDADSEVDPATLRKQLEYYYQLADPNVAIVTPAMKIRDGGNLLQRLQRLEYMTFMFVARLMSQMDSISVAPGPFSLYRTDILRKVGGFLPGNPTEDMEIAYRLQDKQYVLRHCFDAYVYTIPPSTLTELMHQRRNRWFKGGLINTLLYRHMFLKREYGDFGMIMMLVNTSGYVMSFFTLGLFSVLTIRPMLSGIYKWYLVGFDIMPYLRTWTLAINWMDFDTWNTLLLIVPFMLMALLIYLAHRNARESIRRTGPFVMGAYVLLFYLVLSAFSVLAIIDIVAGVKHKW